jgi:hypothetical protein
MNITGIKSGDIVQCDVRGYRFFALVTDSSTRGSLRIEGLSRLAIPTLEVKARQVIGHWRKSKRSHA